MSGRRNAPDAERLATTMPEVQAEVAKVAERLEAEFRDMQEFEFTIQDWQLFVLQTRTVCWRESRCILAWPWRRSRVCRPRRARRDAVDPLADRIAPSGKSDAALRSRAKYPCPSPVCTISIIVYTVYTVYTV